MTVAMDSTTSHDAGTKTVAGGRFSINSLKRGTSLRVIISLIAVYGLALSTLASSHS